MTFTYSHPRDGTTAIRLEALDARDHIFRTIQRTGGFYEADLLAYLDKIRRRAPRPVILDIGANIGNHAVFFARYLGSHVIAVEPNADIIPVLRSNLERNVPREGSWSIIASAVGAAEGHGLLERSGPNQDNVGMARVIPIAAGAPVQGGEVVPVTTVEWIVDTYYRRTGSTAPIGLIKIDVEGMGAAVLQGARGVLDRFAPDIVVEAQDDVEKRAMDAMLAAYGYSAVSRHCATPTYHYVQRPSALLRGRVGLHRCGAWLGRHLRAFRAKWTGAR